jgi:hypothetical protein
VLPLLHSPPPIFQGKRESLSSLLLGDKGTTAGYTTAISYSFERASEGRSLTIKLALHHEARVREASIMPARRDESEDVLNISWL